MDSYFKNILAEVDYKPFRGCRAQREKVSYTIGFKEFIEECFCYAPEEGKPQENPIPSNNKFWEEVKQLSFSLEDGKEGTIKDFIFKYGSISPVIEGIEPVEKLKLKLLYFREVTNWVWWLKEERLEALQENFEEDQKLFDSGFGDNLLWSKVGRGTGNNVAVDFPVRYNIMAKCPSKKDKLVSLAWEIVAQAIARYLGNIPLTPVVNRKNIFFRFNASSALDAAFLQWYFQEFAYLKTCASKGCENPVFSSRKIYCSERCSNREKKRRYRERKKSSIAFEAKK